MDAARRAHGPVDLLAPAAQIAGVRVALPADLDDLAHGRSSAGVGAAVRRRAGVV
ncbi:hypothetical protein [Cellulomonas sp. URHD0024]|uniref:hypothetical protein n=1 Tax=Cellulomonas sp. URHD0024 TaxID=1302620 RepID=UPI001E34CDBF|nr:hypothetical protein [Cellulomonas sp. URHD0024]